jgi:hypothetical protein
MEESELVVEALLSISACSYFCCNAKEVKMREREWEVFERREEGRDRILKLLLETHER